MSVHCSTFLPKHICEAALQLIYDCHELGETGEVFLEGDNICIEVYPYGLAAAPDKLEDKTVRLKLLDRDPGGAAFCLAGYIIHPKSPSGRARKSKSKKQYLWKL